MLGNFLLGLVPILWLVIALTVLKLPGYQACSAAIVIAWVIAVFHKKMTLINAGTAALEGVLSALWPILIVIIAALFTYNLTLKTGAMEKIKEMLAGISKDQRLLALIIGWSFGCFMEGMAGFGTAVAIPASILVALGFEALPTVVGLLVVNSTPTAFGSVGVPITSVASAAQLSVSKISANTALIEGLLMFLSPFVLIFIIGKGKKAFRGILPVIFISALAFTVPNVLIATWIGPELPDIIGSICALAATSFAAWNMRGREIPEEYLVRETERSNGRKTEGAALSNGEKLRSWSPFIFIFLFLLFTSRLFPFINAPLSGLKSSIRIYSGPGAAPTTFMWVNTPGVWILIAAVAGGLVQGAKLGEISGVFLDTIRKNIKTIITICAVLATAKLMVHSGMTTDVADTLVIATGKYFPLFSPIVGVLGAFVTGSGTNTGVLFGPLQAEAARQIAVSPEWLCAANALGAGIGKMIAPSNIALSCAAAGIAGKDSKVMSQVIRYTVLFAAAGGILCYLLL